MSEAALPAQAWPDPLDLALHPRSWLALGWPVVQVAFGSISATLLSTGYGMALALTPLVVGLPLFSLVTRGAWWLAEVEAQLAARLAGVTLPSARLLPAPHGFLLGLGDLIGLPAAWTRVLGLLLTLPLGTVGLGLVTTVFCLALSVMILTGAGFFGFQVSTEGWVAPPVSASAQALWCLGGLAAVAGALYLAFAWVRLHAWLWRVLRG
jgi:hypothetical protein